MRRQASNPPNSLRTCGAHRMETLNLRFTRRKALAKRVHAGAPGRMVGNEESSFVAGEVGQGRDAEPSRGAGPGAPGPRPPR
jgi:hypothetical protein